MQFGALRFRAYIEDECSENLLNDVPNISQDDKGGYHRCTSSVPGYNGSVSLAAYAHTSSRAGGDYELIKLDTNVT